MPKEAALKTVQNLITLMAQSIVPNTESVAVEMKENATHTLVIVRCHNEDVRFLLGKGGANSQGIKSIGRAAGLKLGVKVEVTLDVPPPPVRTTNA